MTDLPDPSVEDLFVEYEEEGSPELVLEKINMVRVNLDHLEQHIIDNEDEIVIE